MTPETLSALEEAVLDVLAYLGWEEDLIGPQMPIKNVLQDAVAG